MTDMDNTAAPYGDIVALYPAHSFIPTMSALDYDSPDLFHAVTSDPDPVAHTPFDVVYVPSANQEHVQITSENAAWIKNEIELGVTAVILPTATARLQLAAPAPNPSSGPLEIGFALPRGGPADLRIFDVCGREVAHPVTGFLPAGPHRVTWNGKDESGNPGSSGVYFVCLAANGEKVTRRVVRVF
jgi:hypothetical protein